MSDPIVVLNEDVYCFILQHFDFVEIQKASLVSRLWYETVGSSRHCISKLVYSIDNKISLEVLKGTLRKYENFKVNPYRPKELAAVIRNFKVKCMQINEVYGNGIDFNDYLILMKSFAQSVKHLVISEVAIKNVNRCMPKEIDFLNLLKCHCHFTDSTALTILLGENPKLEHLVLSANFSTEWKDEEFLQPHNIIINLLKKNCRVHKLCLINLETLFLHTDISMILNRVVNLTITTNFSRIPKFAKENFLKFLNAQISLQNIQLLGCKNKDILVDIWNSTANKVKYFKIDCNVQENNITNLQENNFIQEIDFSLTSSIIALSFLKVSPKVKYIKVRQLSKQLLQYCMGLKYLEVVTFQSIEADTIVFLNRNMEKINNIKLKQLDFFEFLNKDINKISH